MEDQSTATEFSKFKNELAAIKNTAITSKGVHEEEFQRLVEAAFRKYKKRREQKRFFGIPYLFKKIAWYTLLTVVVLTCIYFAALHIVERNKYLHKKLVTYVHDHEVLYKVARFLRKAILPLHRILPLEQAYRWECLVNNPFRVGEQPTCDVCQYAHEIVVMSSAKNESLLQEKMDTIEPIIIHDEKYYANRLFTYAELRDMVARNQETIKQELCGEVLFSEGIGKSVIDYVIQSNYSDIIKSNFSGGWQSCGATTSRVFRNIYPRPACVPLAWEIPIEKQVWIAAPSSSEILLKPSQFQVEFIIELAGRSKVSFVPKLQCEKSCNRTIEVYLNRGEVLVNHRGSPWDVKFQAVGTEATLLHIMEANE